MPDPTTKTMPEAAQPLLAGQRRPPPEAPQGRSLKNQLGGRGAPQARMGPATAALYAAIRSHLDAGEAEPACFSSRTAWLDPEPEVLPLVMALCARCPLRTPCARAAPEHRVGVWGGVNRGSTRPATTTTRATDPEPTTTTPAAPDTTEDEPMTDQEAPKTKATGAAPPALVPAGDLRDIEDPSARTIARLQSLRLLEMHLDGAARSDWRAMMPSNFVESTMQLVALADVAARLISYLHPDVRRGLINVVRHDIAQAEEAQQ